MWFGGEMGVALQTPKSPNPNPNRQSKPPNFENVTSMDPVLE